jgi:hypothetical protein
MAETTPQTPRRSKRHHPVVFTTGNVPSLQARHDKWTSPPLHTRSTTSADLVDDEESTVDATTTFYSDFSRSSRATGRSGKGTYSPERVMSGRVRSRLGELLSFLPWETVLMYIDKAWFESTFNRIRQLSWSKLYMPDWEEVMK